MSITDAAGVSFAAELGVQRVVVGRRTVDRRDRKHCRRQCDRYRGLRAWRPVRQLQRPVFLQRGLGRTFGQSRSMRPGLSPALWPGRRRQRARYRRCTLPVVSARLDGARTASPPRACRRALFQDRGSPQRARVRGDHRGGLPRDARSRLARTGGFPVQPGADFNRTAAPSRPGVFPWPAPRCRRPDPGVPRRTTAPVAGDRS